MRLPIFYLLGLIAVTVGVPSPAEAQVGDSAWGTPGLFRVGVATPREARASFSARAGYGLTEGLEGETGSHHRLMGSVGLAVQPVDWLSVALLLDGRYDKHPEDTQGADDGWVGDPRLAFRFGDEVSDGFSVGGELRLWFPGGEAPSVEFDATTVSALLMGSYALSEGVTLALQAGYQIDNSANAIALPDDLRQGDRIALGLSDFNALLLGGGLSYRTGELEVVGELSWDLLLGDGKPRNLKSPLRATAGVRYDVDESIQLDLVADFSLSMRPGVDPGDSLVPIEPRVAITAGLRYALPFDERASEVLVCDEGFRLEGGQCVEEVPIEGPDPETPRVGAITGRVVDETGAAVPTATVTLHVGDTPPELSSDGEGVFRAADVPTGQVRVTVTADGYDDGEEFVDVFNDETADLVVRVVRSVPPGQIRGLVRSFAGAALVADILVRSAATPHGAPSEPVEIQSDGEGRFELDVPPGTYQVTITASGYREQQREVTVEERGVTVLNADMRRER